TAKTSSNQASPVSINIPLVAAAMQAVSGIEMGKALACSGGIAFIYCSQEVNEQTRMIKEIKNFRPQENELGKDKDKESHNQNHLLDNSGKLFVGAAINTHDYRERVPALVEEGNVDLLLIDSSDGHCFFQKDTIKWINARYPTLPLITGNIITGDGFNYLVNAGANAVKVGMGNGSICITQEEKGTGRGQATALMEVIAARNDYYSKNGIYIPIISDGGITSDRDIIIALALGADAVMMGRYFARCKESPTEPVEINNKMMKPYWGEGSTRARLWREARYQQSVFDEGIEGYIDSIGSVYEILPPTLAKIKSAISTVGAAGLREFQSMARIELMSPFAQKEGRVHNVLCSPQ
ncbi:MAG: IMP dehydrogenase, partial [Oligoflexia bacterium]|nr:IMP dehydrogenase [Oligoflexia bacterium]